MSQSREETVAEMKKKYTKAQNVLEKEKNSKNKMGQRMCSVFGGCFFFFLRRKEVEYGGEMERGKGGGGGGGGMWSAEGAAEVTSANQICCQISRSTVATNGNLTVVWLDYLTSPLLRVIFPIISVHH